MNDRDALEAVQAVVDRAMPPDSGATVPGLLGDLSAVLAAVGLDQWEAGPAEAD